MLLHKQKVKKKATATKRSHSELCILWPFVKRAISQAKKRATACPLFRLAKCDLDKGKTQNATMKNAALDDYEHIPKKSDGFGLARATRRYEVGVF
jgi:hypothetical protein